MILSCIFLETEKERPSRRVHSDDQRTSSWGCPAMYPRRCRGTWACNTKRTSEGECSFWSSHGNHMIPMFSSYVLIFTATRPQEVGELLTSLRFRTRWLVLCKLPDKFSIVWKNTLSVFRFKITTSYWKRFSQSAEVPSNSLGHKLLNVIPWKENLYSI